MNAVLPGVAPVTSAGSGIGRAVSVGLATDGFEVALVGRHREPLAQLAAQITRLGRRALVAVADVTDAAAIRELFGQVEAAIGRIDLLFNNAATNARLTPLVVSCGVALRDCSPSEANNPLDLAGH